MLNANSVGIEEGSEATRVLAMRGGTGHLQVSKAIKLTGAEERGPAAVGLKLRTERLASNGICLGIGGSQLTLRYNLVPPVPDFRLQLIMKYEVEGMAEKSSEPLSADWRKLEIPESQGDDNVLLVAMGKESLIKPQVEAYQTAGARVRLVMPHPIALYHAYRQPHKTAPRETVLLADLGGRESHVALVADGRLLFARTVGFGGGRVDDALAGALGVDSAHARAAKEKLVAGTLAGHLTENIQPALRGIFGQVLSMLQSSVSFCRSQTKVAELRIDRVLLSGYTALLPGLNTYLESSLRMPVELHQPAVAPPGGWPGHPCEWVTAFGLAAGALDSEHFYLDLLPAAFKERRHFRERTFFMYAAAAVLGVALLIKFGSAYAAGASNNALAERYENDKTRVDSYNAEHVSAVKHNAQLQTHIERTSREVLVSALPATVLAQLGAITPAAISIDEVRTTRIEETARVFLMIEIIGKADNSDRNGLEHVAVLKANLEKIPGLFVTPELGKREGGHYPFKLQVSPDKDGPAKGNWPTTGKK
ncbi:MAG: pilus assembly protein PilM [Planctomycetota bacterium]